MPPRQGQRGGSKGRGGASRKRQGAVRGRREIAADGVVRRSSRISGQNDGRLVRDNAVSEHDEINRRVSEAQAQVASEAAKKKRRGRPPQRDAGVGVVRRIRSSEDADGEQPSSEDGTVHMQVDNADQSSSEDDVMEIDTSSEDINGQHDDELEEKYNRRQVSPNESVKKKKKIHVINRNNNSNRSIPSSSSDIRTITDDQLNRIIHETVSRFIAQQTIQNHPINSMPQPS